METKNPDFHIIIRNLVVLTEYDLYANLYTPDNIT